ncbi:microfibril-associated glycoprotein 4-like [Hydractinia symbiolongicarpus]|uniref:microfibril-associated glycoprotein 4-like n=1 Tax=Hydractinia symbiolongicarpus TaxID=13093 RepID=UPI00254B1F6A|nr:microfibril-associated glycoprotein 4-like [Hydractinia symbiolongicarpus]
MAVPFLLIVLLVRVDIISTSTLVDLDIKIKALQSKVDTLETQVGTSSSYCRMLQKDICGPCTCLDDYTIPQKYYCDCRNLKPQRDCLQHYQSGVRVDGLYMVHMNNLKMVQVYCDQTTDGGGWTVFQRRMDGTVNFYRNWREYKIGFGKLQHEFYLGNENLYILTLQSLYPKGSQLRVDMVDWDDRRIYAKYSSFQVDNENTKYTIHLGSYSGNAGYSLTYHDGQKFSTYDKDYDASSDNCAQKYRGAWWFKSCHLSDLNGEYVQKDAPHPGSERGVYWYHYKYSSTYSLKFTEMKVRRL